MNSLSLLIYISYITDRLDDFLIFLMIATGLISAVLVIASLVVYFDDTDGRYNRYSSDEMEKRRALMPRFKHYATISFVTFFVSGVGQAVLPDRNTVLLIAASQIGEKIVNNEKVQAVVDPSIDLLKTWMVKQTADLKKSMDPAATTQSK